MIVELKKQGTTIFLTTHYIEEAERICDRIAFICEGQIVATGSVPQLMERISHGHAIQFVTDKNIKPFISELQTRFEGSTAATLSDHSFVMRSERRIPLLPVMEYLHDNNVEVHEARELHPSLEDVFVKLTGIESSVLRKDGEKGGRQ
jgi:ABC-2 type transport system ATP-binding protein